jgi:hypothetical protein
MRISLRRLESPVRVTRANSSFLAFLLSLQRIVHCITLIVVQVAVLVHLATHELSLSHSATIRPLEVPWR